MTGYARADGEADGTAWTWETKSVNGRGLDIRCRFPPGMDVFEKYVRSKLADGLDRGNVTVSLSLSRPDGAVQPSVNREFLETLMELSKSYAAEHDGEPPRVEALLAVRGVVEVGESQESDTQQGDRNAAIQSSFDKVVEDLRQARLEEGAHLEQVLRDQLKEIETLYGDAERLASLQPEALKARLIQQVRELAEAVPAIPEERLAQEAALLLVKYDVREELDRIAAHIAQANELVGSSDAVGRRLDFVAQEMNREANTVCSKSSDSELSRIGLGLKTVIDRLREQVQNIE
jgi:uncharacterized protein (TIGR00255 family)